MEVWKDIIGYEGYYQVSNMGNVRSLDRVIVDGRHIRGRVLAPIIRNGYHEVTLQRDRMAKQISIHVLVAMAFIPNPENKRTVNHKGGVKSDNRASELEWATYSEQIRHSMRVLGNNHILKAVESNKKAVYQYTRDGQFIAQYDSVINAANRNEGRAVRIGRCCNGAIKSYRGDVWSFVRLDNAHFNNISQQ